MNVNFTGSQPIGAPSPPSSSGAVAPHDAASGWVLPQVVGDAPSGAPTATARIPVLDVHRIVKSFDATRALKSVNLQVFPGEILAIVGHNGAGKSTLVKAVVGLITRDSGEVIINGTLMPPEYSIRTSRQMGVSLALQEISLCPDLRVEENIGIAHPELIRPGWRRQARDLIEERLNAIFPNNGISPRTVVGRLSLARRQMLQTAMATISPSRPIRLLILDEPTSSLRDEFSKSLFTYLRSETSEHGLAVVLVSHKMNDIVGGRTDRTVVMRDGRVVAELRAEGLTTRAIIEAMGGVPAAETRAQSGAGGDGTAAAGRQGRQEAAGDVLSVDNLDYKFLSRVSLSVPRGKVVGLAGLEGNGQREVLQAVWQARHGSRLHRGLHRAIRLRGRVSYLSGDRQKEGILRLWSLSENLTLSILRQLSVLGFFISRRAERRASADWIERLNIKGSLATPISALSGGTQQKVLLARGLAAEPDLLLLDDPFRGVDVTTKTDAYRRLRDEAVRGTSSLWYTTENSELLECDVVYVLRRGSVVATLSGDDLNEGRIISSSFEALAAEAQQP